MVVSMLSNKIQEKPKEKTVFNVMLESFDAGAKPKVIREVKALVPNLTLIDVRSHYLVHVMFDRHPHRPRSLWSLYLRY